MPNNWRRFFRHLLLPPWYLKRVLTNQNLQKIEALIQQSEQGHTGEIRFAVETALDIGDLWKNVSARERALVVFSQLGIWDTEGNNGVLIYLLIGDRDVEIIADRGINNIVGSTEWQRICHAMEELFRGGKFFEGIALGIQQISEHLARHFPARPTDINELANKPVIL